MTTQAQIRRIQRDRKIVAKIRGGAFYADLAIDYGLTLQRIWQIGQRAGLRLPRHVHNRPKDSVQKSAPTERRALGTKACTQCGQSKKFSEFSRSARESDGLQDNCKACNKTLSAAYRAANVEKERERHAAYHAAHKEQINAKTSAWQKANPERVRAKSRQFYADNREKELARRGKWTVQNPSWIKAYNAQWRISNPEKCRAHDRAYIQRLMRAAVKWANQAKIHWFYAEAARLTKNTGIMHHVDHTVPLQSRLVCGLHCEDNLQILTERENLKKHNKFAVM